MIAKGEGSVWDQLSCVGDGFEAFEEEKAVVGEDEILLFFAEDGVGDFYSIDELGVGFFLDDFENLCCVLGGSGI